MERTKFTGICVDDGKRTIIKSALGNSVRFVILQLHIQVGHLNRVLQSTMMVIYLSFVQVKFTVTKQNFLLLN